MERDLFFASIINENDNNYLYILNGWAIQLTDDRSGVARQAVISLAAVLSSMLLCIRYPANIFNHELIINPIYNGIFTLVKNRRLKDMADDAYESLIQITDIFAELATDFNENSFQFMKIIIDILENHSNPKIEKHEKARQSCIGAAGFLLYGIQPPQIIPPDEYKDDTLKIIPHHVQMSTPIGALSNSNDDDDDDEKNNNKEKQPPKAGTKLSKNMQKKKDRNSKSMKNTK
eukprot:445558_1